MQPPEPCRSQGLEAEGISCAASPERQHQKRRVSSMMGEEAAGTGQQQWGQGSTGMFVKNFLCRMLG